MMDNKDLGRSGADAPSGSRPTDGAGQAVSTADAASIPNAVECPSCGQELTMDTVAALQPETDLTLTLHLEPGHLCMAKTVAGVIENFAAMQEAVAKSLDCEISTFIAGLKYEDDVIYITFRMIAASGMEARQGGDREDGRHAKHDSPTAEGRNAQPQPPSPKEQSRG